MANIRSSNEIILSMIDFLKLAVPDLDTKIGTVSRDLFIDLPAAQLSLLYDELSSISDKQSLRLVIGSDLDKLSRNFGIVRNQSTTASGNAILTFSSINSTININAGALVTAGNGFSYAVVSGTSVTTSATNFYRSVATKYRDQLDAAGISDQYAVVVTVKSTTSGSSGNIGAYSLSKTNIPGVSNVTNVNPFIGGSDQENDANFRNRILSSFSGSSVGTALGYLNVALGTSGVSDSYVVTPGDPLMTRDGTIVKINTDNTRTIISEGSGGKVDVVILGSNLIENKDTFIYVDKSNNNDPANIKNNIVLGQIAADANKTINRKRIDDIANGVLPSQPVSEILEVTGSISGSNFVAKSTDSLGRVSGNYELIKDTGVYAGSAWGFDTFHWISDRISLFSEDKIKGQYNGQDATTFTGVLDIPQIQQSVPITNENSIVTSDRSIIQLLHKPATNITRVFNIHTGERYIVTNQNLDQTGVYNTTGRIKISGNTLPSSNDNLQVDYSWIVDYDPYSDYDGLNHNSNPRAVTDSIDWGLASDIKNETISFTKDIANNFFVGTSSHPITTVLSAKTFVETNGIVTKITSGIFVNKLSVNISYLASATVSVESIVFNNTNIELFNTAQNDGTFITSSMVVGIDILYTTTIILPTDTTAIENDKVTTFTNGIDVFNNSVATGSSSNNQITIPSSAIDTLASKINLKTTYIANVLDTFSSAITALPSSRYGNGYLLSNNSGFSNFSQVNISRRENQIVLQNTSSQFYIELNLPSVDYSLVSSQVLSVIRLSDYKEIWNYNNVGTIITGTSGNYQLIFSGFNTPVINDRVLVIYYASDTKRFQPFSYENILIKTRVDILAADPSGKLTIPLNSFSTQVTPISFTIIQPNTDIISTSVSGGQLISNSDGTASIISPIINNLGLLSDLVNHKIVITSATDSNNNGVYDIISYNLITNTIIITNILNKITKDQIAIIRILDGKEVWSYSATIDAANNKLLIPGTNFMAVGDKVYVMFFKFGCLRRAATKLIGTTTDQVVNSGVITISGTTLTKATDIVFTATNTGLKLNLSEAVRKTLGIASNVAIPSNIKIARIAKMEKVITASASDDSVLKVLTTYDLKNTTIQNNLLYSGDFLEDETLQNLDFILPSTANNTLNTSTHNLPIQGDKIRITFYYIIDNDLENLSYTKNGVLYTNKRYALINKIYPSSGFSASQSTKISITSFTQPNLGAKYKVFYDYLAPKQNERILVRYNNNSLISDVTFSVEKTRPINADVLVRSAKQVLLDLTMNVVISNGTTSTNATILQNLRDQLVATMTTNKLGQIVDVPTLINVAQAVSGIARARVLYFNKTGGIGQVTKVQAQADEYFSANNIVINTETR